MTAPPVMAPRGNGFQPANPEWDFIMNQPPGNVSFIPPGLEPYYKDVFTYNVIFNPLAAATTSTQTTTIQNDSFFVVTHQTATIWDSATQATTNTSPVVAPILVRVLDSSSGKYKMDQATPIAALFGTSSLPFIWQRRAPLYMPGGQIQVEATNQTAATSFTVRFQFTGIKIYKQLDILAQMR